MLVMHGGAGTITRATMTAEVEAQYRAALEQALRTGHAVLSRGGTSLDAVEASIRVLEDSPLFNAGKGSVFTHEGKNEMDASIMDGSNKMAGSVAGVTIVKNPISAARAVMEKSPHVMLIGRGAELFATKMGLEIVDPSYFWTERRWKGLQQELLKEQQRQANVVARAAGRQQQQLERASQRELTATVRASEDAALALFRKGQMTEDQLTSALIQLGRAPDTANAIVARELARRRATASTTAALASTPVLAAP